MMARNRIISLLIALILCIGIVPTNAAVTEIAALPQPEIVVTSDDVGPSSDSFVSGKMDSQWTILRPVTTGPLAYEIEKGLGLKLKTQASGMQTDQISTPENVFMRPGNANQWEAVAKVYFPAAPNQNYQQIAFGVFDSENNYVKLDIEYNNGTRRVQFSINRSGTYSHTHWTNLNNGIFPVEANANRGSNLVAYYKIVKNDNTYKAYVSFDGETYYTVGSRSGASGGSDTNGEYTVEYNNPKIYVSAIKDYDSRSAEIDTYCEFVKIYNINGAGPAVDVLESAFNDVVDYVEDEEAIENIPDTVDLSVGKLYRTLAFKGLPRVPYGYKYVLTPESPSKLSVNNTLGMVTAKEAGTTTLNLELVQGNRTQLIKTINVNISGESELVTVYRLAKTVEAGKKYVIVSARPGGGALTNKTVSGIISGDGINSAIDGGGLAVTPVTVEGNYITSAVTPDMIWDFSAGTNPNAGSYPDFVITNDSPTAGANSGSGVLTRERSQNSGSWTGAVLSTNYTQDNNTRRSWCITTLDEETGTVSLFMYNGAATDMSDYRHALFGNSNAFVTQGRTDNESLHLTQANAPLQLYEVAQESGSPDPEYNHSLLFMSDLHQGIKGYGSTVTVDETYYPNLQNMLDALKEEGFVAETVGFGGDYVQDEHAFRVDWSKVFATIDGKTANTFPNSKRVYTTGNHEFESTGGISHADFKNIFGYDRSGLAYSSEDYDIYMIGAESSTYAISAADSAALETYLASVKDSGKVVFVQSHWPLHTAYNWSWREVAGAGAVIDALNRYADDLDIVYLYGHNHYTDMWRQTVHKPGDTIGYGAATGSPASPSQSAVIKFIYANVGCMNDMYPDQTGRKQTDSGPASNLSVFFNDREIKFEYNKYADGKFDHDATITISGTNLPAGYAGFHNNPSVIIVPRLVNTEPVTIEFDYNYTDAPDRPDSFTRQTDINGKLDSFPVEQTLPQAGAREDYGFVGWYTNPEGTGEKVSLDTVFTKDIILYAKWEQVPSLYKEYEDYFLMGAFQDYSTTSNVQWNKHYNVMCPSNNFKLTNQINTTAMRNNFTEARNSILSDPTLTAAEKEEALQRANEEIVLVDNPRVLTQLNNIRAWNEEHPDEKKYTRFHVVAWHGGQQPNIFFTNGYQYSNDATSLSKIQNLLDPENDGAFASRETMKARLDNYIKLLMERYAPYNDIILSWDIVNEPVDDFTGQIRNGTDSSSQRGQWGLIWHDMNPARNLDGSIKYTTAPNAMGVINDVGRLYDESEWMRWAFESSAKWSRANDCDWGLYVNDYMDSNKLYTKLQPTLDITQWIRDDVDLKGIKLGWGMQGRLAWAYPTIDMLRQQVEDGLEICDQMAVTEADIRSDFEPNPFFDPTQPSRPVQETDTPQWNANDLNSGSGSYSDPLPSALMNCFDTHNSPVRRIPEWGTGNGMTAGSDRYNAVNYLPISEEIMKKQADFAADWMDILIENADKVEVFQWDGYSDSNTFNSSKGCHLWVNSGITGRSGTFEKYSFFAVIGAPARDKLNKAIIACPALSDADKFANASAAWAEYVEALDVAKDLLEKRIYTLEGVNDVKDATKALYDVAAVLEDTCTTLTYNANDGSGEVAKDTYTPGTSAIVKTGAAVGFSKTGYTFDGWNTGADGGGVSYASGTTIKMDKNVMLYAQWKADPKACTVAYESYGGTEVASVSVVEGDKVSKPENPRKDGYLFAGWYRDMALTNKWDFDDGIVSGNMRLYAKWSNSFVVSNFNAYLNDSGKITVEFQNADTSPVSGTFFVAIYDKGVLVRMEQQELNAPASSADSKSFDNIDPANYTGEQYQIKAFAWGKNYVPLDSAIVIK